MGTRNYGSRSEFEPRKKPRPASSPTDRLRNVYQTGDESGLQPADGGEAFSGLARKESRFYPTDDT